MTEDSVSFHHILATVASEVFPCILTTIPLSQSQYLCYGGSNGKISWLGCELMYIATKLTVFVGMLLQEAYLLSLPFSYN
jgi:hypothetical protein